jgi:signal transduction histidine kinase
MQKNKFSLGLRFSLMVGVILMLFCAVFSLVLYQYLRNQVIKDAEDKTTIIVTHVKALGGYVRDTLRPKIFDILSSKNKEEAFMIEGMSTTHVNLQVMKRFAADLPDYVYKRLSDRPLNAANKADDFHLGLMHYFERQRSEQSWRGIVTLANREYLVSARPVISDASCMACHESRETAPRPVVLKYAGANFGWKPDAVVGVESISIPVDVALARIKKVAIHTFLLGSITLVLLFLAIYTTFRMLVTNPLNRLSLTFRGIAGGTQPLGQSIPIMRDDEIGDVTESFNALSHHLLEAQEKLKKTAEMEKQMMETEKLASLGQLSAGVAHEINNPLGGIKLCFNNLMTTDMDEEKRKQHVRVINSGFDRIQIIVKSLLDFSKNSSLSVAPASLNGIVEDVLGLAEYTVSKKGIRLVKDLSPRMPQLAVDSNKLEQVFLNLIMNAVQAMDGGGTLTVRTRCGERTCSLSVSDTGKGIPHDVMPRIYDPFFSTKGVGEGTGLGLTVSKAIVEQHGGEMAVETSEQGTTFTVSLPAEKS